MLPKVNLGLSPSATHCNSKWLHSLQQICVQPLEKRGDNIKSSYFHLLSQPIMQYNSWEL